MELLAGLLASVKLMKRVGGRRRGEPQGGPVTQVGSCLRSWMGQDHDGRPVPSGLQIPVRHQGQRLWKPIQWRRTALGVAFSSKRSTEHDREALNPEP